LFFTFFFTIFEKKLFIMARPKGKNNKKALSTTINKELDEILDKICEEKGVNKSKYIEYLIKKEMDKGK